MKEGTLFIIFLVALTSACDTISQLFLKTAVNHLNFNADGFKKTIIFVIKLLKVPWVYAGFLFSCLSLCIWLYALSKADLNFAFSVDSMHYIFIAFASSVVLKEKVGSLRWIGTICVVIGIVLVSIS